MKSTLLKVMTVLGISVLSLPVMAHGVHAMITPDHGLQHAAYYGIGIVVAALVVNQLRKVFTNKKDK